MVGIAGCPLSSAPTRAWRWSLALVLLVCTDCGAGGGDPDALGRVGTRLLDEPGCLQEIERAGSNLPEPGTRFGLRRSARVPAETWERVSGLPAFLIDRFGPKAVDKAWYWRARPDLRLDLPRYLGARWMEYEGREVVLFAGVKRGFDRLGAMTWQDAPSGTYFHWDAERGELQALSVEPPREVRFGYGRGELRVESLLEHFADEAPAEEEPATVTRLRLGGVTRDVVLAPAPTVYRVELRELDASELRAQVGILDLAFGWERGQLGCTGNSGDGVVFTLDVVTAAGSKRVLSRHVAEFGQFVDLTADLSDYRGQDVTLRLGTEPGPAGDARFDYALWSGLEFAGETERRPSRPHLVLVDIDTLRADRLSCYGYGRSTSPRIDAWARRARIFEDANAVGNWTLPSTASILTGLSVRQHGVEESTDALSPDQAPVAALLKAHGYRTFARTDGGNVSADFGFDIGFDEYDARPDSLDDWGRVLGRIRERVPGRPQFWFLQTYRVHAPHEDDRLFEDPADPYDGRYVANPIRRLDFHGNAPRPDERDWQYVNDVYDAGVFRMDEQVGPFLAGLEEAFQGESYLVILTSDHGEEIAERGEFGHGQSLFREQLHVPLILFDSERTGGERSADAVSSLDIVPTLLERAGLARPSYLTGRSLLAEPLEPRPRIAERTIAGPAERRCVSIEKDGWKLVRSGPDARGRGGNSAALFHVQTDPSERTDLSERSAERVARLGVLLERFQAAEVRLESSEGVLSPEVQSELQRLGYLGDE